MKYLFIAQHKKTWPIDVICRLLGVKRNGFYSYETHLKPQDPLHVEKPAPSHDQTQAYYLKNRWLYHVLIRREARLQKGFQLAPLFQLFPDH